MSASNLPLVLITNTVPASVLAPLAKIARVIMGPNNGDLMLRSEVLHLAPQLAGIINQAELRVDQELLTLAPQLKIVANISIGVDNLNLDLMADHGVYATNTPLAFVETTAEFTLGMMLALARRIPAADRYVRAGTWQSFQPGIWDGTLLQGKTLGLVGYGAIGQSVAHRARAFGMNILHYQRTASTAPGYLPLNELLQASDFVSLHVPLNQDSHHLLNAERLRSMKSGAYLINASRGRVVDEHALVAALQSGHLAGAALDVFENEPQLHPALSLMSNVVLTPHIGGGTTESRHQARSLCVENLTRVLAGLRPVNALNNPKPRAK